MYHSLLVEELDLCNKDMSESLNNCYKQLTGIVLSESSQLNNKQVKCNMPGLLRSEDHCWSAAMIMIVAWLGC